MYGTVNWLNAGSEVVKLRRGMELLTLLFIFRSVRLQALEAFSLQTYGLNGFAGFYQKNIKNEAFKDSLTSVSGLVWC